MFSLDKIFYVTDENILIYFVKSTIKQNSIFRQTLTILNMIDVVNISSIKINLALLQSNTKCNNFNTLPFIRVRVLLN